MSDTFSIDRLRLAAENLVALLKNPEPGLFTWTEAVRLALKDVTAFAPSVASPDLFVSTYGLFGLPGTPITVEVVPKGAGRRDGQYVYVRKGDGSPPIEFFIPRAAVSA